MIQGGDIMEIEKIIKLLNATTHYIPDGKELDVTYGSASDLMSDVLAYLEGGNKTILITGLLTTQVIRTATLMEISVVVFTRGKVPNEQIIEAAKKNNIAILSTKMTKYATCGILYSAGLESVDGYIYSGDDKDSCR